MSANAASTVSINFSRMLNLLVEENFIHLSPFLKPFLFVIFYN